MGGNVLVQDIRIKVTAKQCQVKDFPAGRSHLVIDPRRAGPAAIGGPVEAEEGRCYTVAIAFDSRWQIPFSASPCSIKTVRLLRMPERSWADSLRKCKSKPRCLKAFGTHLCRLSRLPVTPPAFRSTPRPKLSALSNPSSFNRIGGPCGEIALGVRRSKLPSSPVPGMAATRSDIVR